MMQYEATLRASHECATGEHEECLPEQSMWEAGALIEFSCICGCHVPEEELELLRWLRGDD